MNLERYVDECQTALVAGQTDRAIQICEVALNEAPEYHPIHYQLACIKEQQGDIDNALERMTIAMRFEPTIPVYHRKMGDLYRQKRQYSKSISFYQRALELNSGDSECYQSLVRVLKLVEEEA